LGGCYLGWDWDGSLPRHRRRAVMLLFSETLGSPDWRRLEDRREAERDDVTEFRRRLGPTLPTGQAFLSAHKWPRTRPNSIESNIDNRLFFFPYTDTDLGDPTRPNSWARADKISPMSRSGQAQAKKKKNNNNNKRKFFSLNLKLEWIYVYIII
jgi:hypothetical protein